MTQFTDDADDDRPGTVACERCKAECTWHHTGVRWALMGENGRLHQCASVPSADDFEDLTGA